MTTLSQHIGNFIHTLDTRRMPTEVLEKARVCLLNGYGMGLDCHATPYAPVARAAALAMDGEQPRRRDHAGRRPQDHRSAAPVSPIRRCFTAAPRRIPAAPRISAPS